MYGAMQEYGPESVMVMVGPGHNGGGGLVAARHLVNRGVHVVAVLIRTDQLSPTTAHQLKTLREMGVPLVQVSPPASVVVDALIGYSLEGEPRGHFAELIDWANQQSSPVISLDIPSGLDATTGRISGHCIPADATLTLALPKTGLAISPSVVGGSLSPITLGVTVRETPRGRHLFRGRVMTIERASRLGRKEPGPTCLQSRAGSDVVGAVGAVGAVAR